jgi:hypothetical protein
LDNFHFQVEIRAEAVHLFLFVKEEENGACLATVQVRASINQVRVHSKYWHTRRKGSERDRNGHADSRWRHHESAPLNLPVVDPFRGLCLDLLVDDFLLIEACR